MAENYLMALDAGTGSGRCFLISVDGKQAVMTSREWNYILPSDAGPLAAIFDPDSFWDILAELAREALVKAGISGEQVVAISSTSQREACVFLDAAGRELYAGPNRDFRGLMEGKQLAAEYGTEIYHRTGHYPNGIFAPARLLWFKKNAPDTYERFAHLLMMNDWILYRLSGEIACEPTNAGETCMYDLHTREWMTDLINALQLPRNIFPRILPSGTQLGVVHERAAAQTGLKAGTPVVVGGADTQCGLLGCGAIHVGDLVAVLGTTSPVQMVTAQPMVDPAERLWAGMHTIPDLFVLESNVGATGSIYRWFRDTFCSTGDNNQEIGESLYELMNTEAAMAPPGAAGVQSFLGVMVMNAKAMAMPMNTLVLGMVPLMDTGRASRGLLIRAILESLACAVEANTRQIVEVVGHAPSALAVCGGLAKSSLYLEIMANVMNIPVRVPRWKEGSGVGTAICAGVGAGIYRNMDEGVAALVHLESNVEPIESLCRQYATVYDAWIKTRETLTAIPASFF
jgi:sugar (pentulose or hexulose) kinase